MFSHLIVGAGFAGAVCAERLASAGKHVLIVERRAHIGGNAYDEYDDAGILVSRHGAHVFHTNSDKVFAYLSRFTDWRPYEHRLLASVKGQYVPVPINDTTLAAFGGDLASATAALYEPYTRKQWGPYADELSPTVLARVKPHAGTDDRYFTDTHQAMPLHGYTRMFQRILSHPNIKIMLKTSYQDVRWDFEYEAPGGLMESPDVIYTGPIDEFFNYDDGRLPYRSAVFRYETHQISRFQPVGVVNYPAAEYPYTRCIEFKHLTGQAHRCTTVAYEYPQAEGEPYWPVPTAASAALYRRYAERARQVTSVHFCGRLGRYLYLDMDQVVAQALTLSAKLLKEEMA